MSSKKKKKNSNSQKNKVEIVKDNSKSSSLDSINKKGEENVSSNSKLNQKSLNKEKNSNQEKNASKIEMKKETQEEKVVFKNSQKKTEEKSVKKTDANIVQKEEKENIKISAEKNIIEEKEKKKRKLIVILAIVIVILVVTLIFSTIFAMIHSMNTTIAKGVTIRGIDVSRLTYDEAKEKLDEAFKTILDVNINLNYKDEYSYTINPEDVELTYNFKDELEKAYSVGRKGNIIECNYSLIATALMKKDINFEYKYNENNISSIIDEVSTSIPGLVTQYSHYIEENNLIICPGKDGIQVEKDELKKLIIDNLKNRNPLDIIKNYKNTKIEIPYKEVKAEKIDIDKIYSEIHTEPKDAYYEPATENRKS